MSFRPTTRVVVEEVCSRLVEVGKVPVLVTTSNFLGSTNIKRFSSEDGKFSFSMAPKSVHDVVFHPSSVSFTASFSTKPLRLDIPYYAIVGIYDRESGVGVWFDDN